ncbi:MAG TPA: hypothetical protein VN920_07450 [Pyrinomonadaceae bacterium]|nr:hypothetical protein [Pyrinomonadaceae bacterium]
MLQNQLLDQWSPKETTTHQDHVIAHVIGATVLGYFVHDEALHLLLDMGFIWTIYLDGQMVLLPQSVAISELEAEPEIKAELNREVEKLDRERRQVQGLQHITPAPLECLLTEVSFLANDERRRLILVGEEASLVVETSLSTAEIKIAGL